MDEPLVNFLDRSAHSWQERLAYIVDAMRELSTYTDPHAMVAAYSARMRSLRMGRVLSLSRRGVTPPSFLLARDSEWETQPNPWRDRSELPVLEGGLLGEIAYGDEVRLVQELEVPPDDPAAERLSGFRSLLALPVFDGGAASNVVVFLRRERNAFDPEELPALVWMTNLFGRLTHNLVLNDEVKRAYAMLDEELKTIADIQRSLLPPELPRIPSIDLAVHYRPATRAGGDYYDFFPLSDGAWGFLIADVSGHGSPAAVEMAITRTLAHVHVQPGSTPASLLAFINDHFATRCCGGRGAFVTAFSGIYDPSSRELRYASAGHHPPRVKRCRDGSLFSLESGRAPPLGVVANQAFPEADVQLEVGDQMILYTDGITEAFNPQSEMFGLERLDRTLENCGIDARAIIDGVLGELDRFIAGRELADDITLICARVTAGGARAADV